MEEKEPYFQVSKSLFRLRRNGGISLAAFDIYLLMEDRFRLSKKNKWIDENGELYILYSYDELMEDMNLKKRNSISGAIKELSELGIIKKIRRFNKSNKYYFSNSNHIVTVNSNQKGTTVSNHKVTYDSNQMVYTNKNYMNKNYMNKNYMNNNYYSVSSIIINEIRFLIKNRNIKMDNILKYSNDIEKIKAVFEYADINNKGDGWIVACLRDNYNLSKEKKKFESTALKELKALEKKRRE